MQDYKFVFSEKKINCSILRNYFHIVKIYQLFRTPTYLKWIQGENDKEYKMCSFATLYL